MKVTAGVKLVESDGKNSPCYECFFEHMEEECPSELCQDRYFFERSGDWEIIDETDD